ncbi:ABC transporter permease [Methanocalculus sp.]|uniref:ABC transporter permease n=1 Tax=Methanocalculus sp. TaxID=2004547 RepID=UPI00271822BA|nr:ABC transporter permease [Methanocalculus sp.]MDO8842074.1 ABC transporter permease [Methanocalculus sp.]
MGYIANRLIRYAVCLICIITLNFALPRAMPGDPVWNIIGEDVYVSEEALQEIRRELGLDRSLFEQFQIYISSLLHFDLGYSYILKSSVFDLIISRMGWTLLFVGIAIIIGAIIGFLVGAYTGWRSETRMGRLISVLSLVISCTPAYFLGLLFLLVFSFRLGLFPFKGLYTEPTLASIAHHLFLPILVMSLFAASRNILIMRGSTILEKASLYALYARAKGCTDRGVLYVHVLKNASLPLIAQVALDFGFVFSGALVVEIVFTLNGMGTLIYNAVLGRDYPILQGSLLLIAITVIIANLAADLISAVIDPRIREVGR